MIYLVSTEVVIVVIMVIAWRIMRNHHNNLRAAQGIILAVILSAIIWIGGVILWKLLN